MSHCIASAEEVLVCRMSEPVLWSEGAPWDLGESSLVLLEKVGSIDFPRGEVLVPGCGAGYDVLNLARDGKRATGVEKSAEAEVYFEALRRDRGVPRKWVNFVCADFFDWKAPHPFVMVWDDSFFSSLPVSMHERWASRMAELLSTGGQLWVLLFPEDIDVAEPTLPSALLEGSFSRVSLDPVARSHAARSGKEWLGCWVRK